MSPLRVVIALMGMTFPAVTLAQAAPVRDACVSDIRTLCGSVQPGGGRIRECMREHRAQLSVGCKVAIADRMLERNPSRPNAPNGGVTRKPAD